MKRIIAAIAVATVVASFLAIHLRAQQGTKPSVSITSIKAMPGEPIPKGTCTYSTSGYLEKDGKREFKDADLGKLIAPALRQGYVITLYPPTKHGIYAYQECPSSGNSTAIP